MPTPVPLTRPDQTPEERRAIIEAAEMPTSIGDLLDQGAADSPDRVLWTFFDEGISHGYGEVAETTRKVGAALARGGDGTWDGAGHGMASVGTGVPAGRGRRRGPFGRVFHGARPLRLPAVSVGLAASAR